MPRQIERVLVALLPKASGGFRPIGLFPSLYRLWGRVRRPMAARWEQSHSRDYFAAGQYAGATDVVWRQAVLSEAGALSGQVAFSVLWDMSNIYECFTLASITAISTRLYQVVNA